MKWIAVLISLILTACQVVVPEPEDGKLGKTELSGQVFGQVELLNNGYKVVAISPQAV